MSTQPNAALADAAVLFPPAFRRSTATASVRLDAETRAELELVLNGGFHPIDSFLGREDVASVRASMRLRDGRVWPIPFSLPVLDAVARGIAAGDVIDVHDDEGTPLASVRVSDVWRDDENTARVAGAIQAAESPVSFELQRFRLVPSRVRALVAAHGRTHVLGASPGALLHPGRKQALFQLADELDATVVLLPVLGCGVAPALDPLCRLLSIEAALTPAERRRTVLALMPVVRRYRHTQELLLRAFVARNCGCTHVELADESAPAPWAVDRELLDAAGRQLGLTWVQAPIVHPDRAVAHGSIGEEHAITQALAEGRSHVPAGLSDAALAILRRRHPARHERGFTIFLTGLSGAGKSTIARALKAHLEERSTRPVTLLDGDVVRTHLSSELGFSRDHRDLNVRRIGFVAAEITRHRGIAICAPIAPYEQTRRIVQDMVECHGGFVLVHVATALAVCEARDPKGLYAKARAGALREFTGVSDPYEVPPHPSLTIDTAAVLLPEAVTRITDRLVEEGYLQCLSD